MKTCRKTCPLKALLLLFLCSTCHGMTPVASQTTPANCIDLSSSGLVCDFESECPWNWTRSTDDTAGFRVISFEEVRRLARTEPEHSFAGPEKPAENDTNEHFLFFLLRPKVNYSNNMTQIWSPWFNETSEKCRLEADFLVHKFRDIQVPFKFLVETANLTGWVEIENIHNDFDPKNTYSSSWKTASITIGQKSKRFRLAIEVLVNHLRPSYVAIDNLRLIDCAPDVYYDTNCNCTGVRCESDNKCIPRHRICDITRDCPNAEDESYCDGFPEGARCDFEGNQTCGWKNVDSDQTDWQLHQGPTRKDLAGSSTDHTFGNASGFYMLSELPDIGNILDQGILESPVFQPPPCYHRNKDSTYHKSCEVRLYYRNMGKSSGRTIIIDIIDAKTPDKTAYTLLQLQSSSGKDNRWIRFVAIIPEAVTFPYQIRVILVRGVRSSGLGLDDFSLSPECFAIGVPEEEIRKCPPEPSPTIDPSHPDFPTTSYKPPTGATVYVFTTCGAKGHKGPTDKQCRDHYQSQGTWSPTFHSSSILQGLQTWKVPHDGYYTIISKGASGGSGIQTQNTRTRGATSKGVFHLKKGTDIHVLVGQEGSSACEKDKYTAYQTHCDDQLSPPKESELKVASVSALSKLKNKTLPGGGGGGGGASYVFMKDGEETVPLAVGAGGGGLAWSNVAPVTSLQHGRDANKSYDSINGETLYDGNDGAGPGGGLEGKRERDIAGSSLESGGEGGTPCFVHQNAYGGFGGGGGGCSAGGGGGGYAGGNADHGAYRHGEGGISYASGLHSQVKAESNIGPGIVFIVPAVRNDCGCQHLCAHLDEHFNDSVCLCTNNQFLAKDGITCYGGTDYVIWGMSLLLVLILISSGVSFYMYRNKKRHLPTVGNDTGGAAVQLNQLRVSSGGGMVTEDNPNYDFGGGTCTVKDLKRVPREHLTLIKALGQGAFGEVYKGYLKTFAGDLVEMPVAVKTLPEMSNNQSEFDFMMEALIMSKFNHPNIVHFIGVCFDKHPRFIVLELLSGGDLKSFLRESRPKPDRPSPLTMKDLLQCAIDVAKGCEYLEENHFIHRDIAARNCLLTTKGPGRVVKIADFGMARDIYRNDYYRKGGKAMLPVKWMPPEAFLDGIFISKTDVWSFGVLLWEVMSLGYMPYPGRGNQEVMQFVTNGGRLYSPRNCPAPIYRIMNQCWHNNSEERPTFTTILERLGYCMQDPDVVASPLPVFQRPPSSERDATVMRPQDGDACLAVLRREEEPQSPASTDYLMPMSYSLSTVRSELRSTPSIDSGNDCFHMERLLEDAAPPPPPTWETSFSDEPPKTAAPRPPPVVPAAAATANAAVAAATTATASRSPTHIPHLPEEQIGASPLLLSPPGSPSPPPPPCLPEARERLLSPDEEHQIPSASVSAGTVPLRDHASRPNHHYHPHRYNNSGSSNNSTSSANSSTASSSSNSNSSSSTASTLPLDPASLPCIPPPLQYVNVDVKKKRPANYDTEPYTIIETQEHREISC